MLHVTFSAKQGEWLLSPWLPKETRQNNAFAFFCMGIKPILVAKTREQRGAQHRYLAKTRDSGFCLFSLRNIRIAPYVIWIYTALMRTLIAALLIAFTALDAQGQGVSTLGNMAACKTLPSTIQVIERLKACGNTPAVILSGSWKGAFSAAFRWDDGSSSGQDRNPSKLDDPSASSSPYKTQRRIRGSKQHILCYGKFLSSKFPTPEQLTIKRSAAPKVDRFCVNFSG